MKRAFTLVELMITIAIIGVFVLIVVVVVGRGCANISGDNERKARQEAELYGQQMFGDALGAVSCTSADTDGDGYVTCALSVKNKQTGEVSLVGVECATAWNLSGNKGCRPQVARIRGR